ncbi:MAG TPA: hypothetical protein PKO15_03335 [Fibrobacteria bacterium]|nr:hypothetical protein [Fibrobacteria bacterium]HOX50569.1 hypothetical protein [Fibrobacteria bacterium]
MKVHGFLHPSVLRKAAASATLDALEFLFDTPSDAEVAIVEILEGDMEFGTSGSTPKSLLKIPGKVAKGVFIPDAPPPPVPAPAKGDRNLLLKIRGPKQTTPTGPYLIPLDSNINWGSEGGVAELVTKFDCKEKTADKDPVMHGSKTAVLVRQSDLHPTANQTGGIYAIVTGADDFFNAAKGYWDARADKVEVLPVPRTLSQLRGKIVPAASSLPWSEVSIVLHGNKSQILMDFGGQQAPNTDFHQADEFIIADEFDLGKVPTAGANVDKIRVVLRGCNIGRTSSLMEQIKKYLGCGELVAPKFLQTYLTLANSNIKEEALSIRLFTYRPGGSAGAVTDADFVDELKATYTSSHAFRKELETLCPDLASDNSDAAWTDLLTRSRNWLDVTSPQTYTAVDVMESQGIPYRKLAQIQAAHGSAGFVAVKNEVEKAYKELWMGREHPHATDADFDELSFNWQQTGAMEFSFTVEKRDGSMVEVDALKTDGWHLVVTLFPTPAEMDATRKIIAKNKTAIAASKTKIEELDQKIATTSDPKAKAELEKTKVAEETKLATLQPEPKLSALAKKRMDWFLAKAGVTDIRRRIASEQNWAYNFNSNVNVRARTIVTKVVIVSQNRAGDLLPSESFSSTVYGVV